MWKHISSLRVHLAEAFSRTTGLLATYIWTSWNSTWAPFCVRSFFWRVFLGVLGDLRNPIRASGFTKPGGCKYLNHMHTRIILSGCGWRSQVRVILADPVAIWMAPELPNLVFPMGESPSGPTNPLVPPGQTRKHQAKYPAVASFHFPWTVPFCYHVPSLRFTLTSQWWGEQFRTSIATCFSGPRTRTLEYARLYICLVILQ